MPNLTSEAAVVVTTPSVYVDQTLLRHDGVAPNQFTGRVAYKIHDDIFYEEGHALSEDKLVEFEVHSIPVSKMDTEYDMYCSTPTDSGSEYADADDALEITIESVQNGYIINKNCFLTLRQWHTIIPTSLTAAIVECVVCGQYCEEKNSQSHVTAPRHVTQLDNCRPLARFDLSIVRKIGNHYHCAVCNELFNMDIEADHLNGKTHEGNLLFAINKASDILNSPPHTQTENTQKTETYKYKGFYDEEICDNTHFINFQNHLYYDDDEILNSEFSYANIAKKPKIETPKFLDIDLGSKKVKVKFDSWHMVISPKVNRMYCMVCKKFDHVRNKPEHCMDPEHLRNLGRCKVVEAYEEYFIRQVDDKLYHCGHCNNLQMIHEMVDHVEVNHPRRTKIVLDTKPNTNSPLKSNRDRQNSVSSDKSSICSDTVTVPKISDKSSSVKNSVPKVGGKNNSVKNSATKVGDNNNSGKNSVTKVGHKNNSVKNSATKVGDENNSVATRNDTENLLNSVKNGQNKNDLLMVSKNKNLNTENVAPNDQNTQNVNRKILGLFDNIFISPFGANMILPVMAYNIICKRPTDYYCGLCNILYSAKEIKNHIYDVSHVELLQRTPFIRPFGCHLIRAIRDALHCTICNMPIAVEKIDLHIIDPQHMASLNKALNIQNVQHLPPIGVKIPNIPSLANVSPNMTPSPFNMSPNLVSYSPNFANMGPNLTNMAPNLANMAPNLSNMTPNPNITPNLPNIAPNLTNMSHNLLTTAHSYPNMAPNLSNMTANPSMSPRIPKHSPNSNPSSRSSPYHTPCSLSPRLTPNNLKGINLFYNSYQEGNDIQNQAETNKDIDDVAKRFEETKVTGSPEPEEIEEIVSDGEAIDRTFDSVASEDAAFDFEEYVYLKLKNSYIKISNTSYNTLVTIGDGSRYCFVCSVKVRVFQLHKHVDSRSHLENIEKYRFLDKYEDHLLRQIYLMYHCAICNVIITRKDLKTHLEWPTHVLLNESTVKNLKKTRKNEIKGGIKQILVSTQKENIYLHESEPKIKICLDVSLINGSKTSYDLAVPKEFTQKNKIIIFNDNVLKITWEAWQGITKVKNGYKCVLCQKDLEVKDIGTHCNIQWHKYSLDKPFEKQYAPALIRKINESTLNCLFCNTELSNKQPIVSEHVNGKKHLKNYEAILKDSSMANTYTDCNDDVLML